MRSTFVETLTEAAINNEKIWLLTGDLGYGVLETFKDKLPHRFINMGVAEQNMVGVAAGIAHSGNVVFTYSIANFATLRCLEQIRNDVCYHNANVKIVAVGGGLVYGAQGYTHHAIEDISILSSFENMLIITPGDPYETRKLMPQIIETDGPCYLRLGRAGERMVHKSNINITLGQASLLRNGSDITIMSMGGILPSAMDAALLLKKKGVSVRLLSYHTIQPLDKHAIIKAAKETSAILTVEEHSPSGGLGTKVAEIIALENLSISFDKINVHHKTWTAVGNQDQLRPSINVISNAACRLLGVN